MRLSILLVFLIGFVGAPCVGYAQSRVALVIGNGAYQAVPPLLNPVNDAGDLSEALKRLGFNVKTLTNARYDDMRRALIDFGRQARGSEISLIFFAGHGMEVSGKNYLIPVDAQLSTDLDAANETIDLTSAMQAVSNSKVLGLVILDACRNNPFLSRMQRTNLTRAVDRGFVRVEPNENVVVFYAAKDGTTASDGTGRNSPFTKALLNNIEMPGMEISPLFRTVRDEVIAATNRGQQPFLYESRSKEQVYLRPAAAPDAAKRPALPVAALPSTPANPADSTQPLPSVNQTGKSNKLDVGSLLADPGVSAGYLVMVSSQASEADAIASFSALQAKFSSLLGGRRPIVRRADLGDKGTRYRAYVGPFPSRDEATQFCGTLKAAGGQCVIQ